MTSSESDWAAALATMNDQDRAAALALRDSFAELDADDPEAWTLSELSQDTPHLAGFLALRRIWPELIDGQAAPGALENLPAAARLLAAGADRDDLARVVRATAYETAFGLLFHLTGHGRDHEAPEDTPGWCLVETTPSDEPTGRPIKGLHEDLLTMDP